MRRSQFFIKTKKQAPADETAANAQLLTRAGFIHKEMAGVYSYLLPGKLVIDNISTVVREEMDKIGGNEVLMSTLQNKELWEKTGRWDNKVVDNWFKTKLLSGTEVGIGLSHEEPLTNMLKNYVSSYKDLPVYPYQIQTKFRNELRAKSGLLRGREFLMKDLYSFSRNQQEHDAFYENAVNAYGKIYDRLGIGSITYKTFASGGIFTKYSHEFQTVSHVGEDTIYLDEEKRLAINKEVFSDDVLHQLSLDKGNLKEVRAVEVGNVFSLGTKYADALDLYFTGTNGERQSIIMGCYGIGISRLMGILAEHFADESGLVWPVNVAPYKVYLARLGDNDELTAAADSLYQKLTEAGISVIYDDLDARPGEKFADADLMGIPYRAVISSKTIEQNAIECKKRTSDKAELISYEKLLDKITSNS